MEFFRAALPEKLASVPLEIGNDDWIDRRESTKAGEEAHVWINKLPKPGEVYGIIQVSKTGQLNVAGAHLNVPSDAPIRPVPKWSISTAIESAASWLKRFGWDLTPDFQIGEVTYELRGIWQVMWHRLYSGVPELQMDDESDQITVRMEEDGTGLRFNRRIQGPEPATTVAKLTRTEGVTLAAKALPAIMATKIYQSWMPKNLVPVELRTAELRILKPNWLLDPKRYSLSGSKTAPERRLCWYVVFLLFRRDKTGERNGEPVFSSTRGLVHVYVDAVSAEIVGGNMEPTMIAK